MQGRSPTDERRIKIIDTGVAPGGTFFAPYADVTYLNLSSDDVVKRFKSMLDRCYDSVPVDAYTIDSIRKLAWHSLLAQYFEIAHDIADKILSGECVILQSGPATNDIDPVISSLVQIIIDPYYRTLDGFSVLVDKEWITSGYAFASRPTVAYPMFYLFCNCVWELQNLHRRDFGFNEHILIAYLDNIHSRQFTTFLFDSESDRLDFARGGASLFVYLANQDNQSPFRSKRNLEGRPIRLVRRKVNTMPW